MFAFVKGMWPSDLTSSGQMGSFYLIFFICVRQNHPLPVSRWIPLASLEVHPRNFLWCIRTLMSVFFMLLKLVWGRCWIQARAWGRCWADCCQNHVPLTRWWRCGVHPRLSYTLVGRIIKCVDFGADWTAVELSDNSWMVPQIFSLQDTASMVGSSDLSDPQTILDDL